MSNVAQNVTMDAETPITQVSLEFAQEEILRNLFYRFQGARPDLEDRLREAFQKYYGVEMMELGEMDEVRAVYLEGPPGQGKTKSHEAACKKFAQLMGMNFIKEPSQHMMASGKIGSNDFVFTIIELAGETSNKEIGGLMAKMKVGDQEFMGHLPDWRLAATMRAGYGYVLFDDFVTATHQVQNATLGLLLNGSAGDMNFTVKDMASSEVETKNGQATFTFDPDKAHQIRDGASPVHFGIAGNRGTRDGNKTFPRTTATTTRVEIYDVFDTLDAFVARTLKARNDRIGDVQYTEFLQKNTELFYKLSKPEQGMLPQMPTSRTHDAFISKLRMYVHQNGGLENIVKMTPDRISDVLHTVEKMAGGTLGNEVAAKVGGYYNALFLGAAPVADAIIRRGEVDTALIESKYNNGNDGAGQNFAYSLAASLASFAAADIAEHVKKAGPKAKKELQDVESPLCRDIRKTLMHMSYGVAQFKTLSMATFATSQMIRRLSNQVPEMFSEANGPYRVPNPSTAELFAYGFFLDNKKFQKDEFTNALADTLVTYNIHAVTSITGSNDEDIKNRIKAVINKK